MPRNAYLDNCIPNLYQRTTIDIMVFTFMDTYKFLYPSVTLHEIAAAFVKRYNIDEGLYTTNTVVATYNRVLKDIYDVEKAKKTGTKAGI